jgi:hypothetical protein
MNSLHPCTPAQHCREAIMHLSFDLGVSIQRLSRSREEHSNGDTIPEAPIEAPRSKIAAGEKV